METQIIRVADGLSGGLKEVKVPTATLNRWKTWAQIQGRSIIGDQHPQTNRIVSGRDALEALSFVTNELAYNEGEVKRYYQPKQYDSALKGCIDFSAGREKKVIEYDLVEQYGQAVHADSASTETPYVDVAFQKKTFNVFHGKVGYQFNQQELRESAFLKRPLPEGRLQAAVEAFQQKLNVSALLGDSVIGYTGLINNANVSAAVTPSGKHWHGQATPAEILSDFNFGLYTIWSATGFNKVATDVGVPSQAFEYIATTQFSATMPGKTILDVILASNVAKAMGGNLNIFPLYATDGAGASSSNRVVFYVREPDTMKFHVPMSLEFLPPQFVDVFVKVPGEFRCSGVAIKRITNVYYMDGV